VVQYGAAATLGTSSDWVLAQNYKPNNKGGFSFDATVAGQTFPVALSIPGMHNLRNALAVMAVIHVLALSMHKAAEALGDFTGTGRRFEIRGEVGGMIMVITRRKLRRHFLERAIAMRSAAFGRSGSHTPTHAPGRFPGSLGMPLERRMKSS
jgi:hypothetical protein